MAHYNEDATNNDVNGVHYSGDDLDGDASHASSSRGRYARHDSDAYEAEDTDNEGSEIITARWRENDEEMTARQQLQHEKYSSRAAVSFLQRTGTKTRPVSFVLSTSSRLYS